MNRILFAIFCLPFFLSPCFGDSARKEGGDKYAVRTDTGSIEAGKKLYAKKCSFCHDPGSGDTIRKPGIKVGPGHKGILKNHVLPVSKRPSNPENIAQQLRSPYRDMPSFPDLSDGDIANIIAFLNTL